ncbi:CehA/McbA family metallohydrolase [Paenibacillus roseipurpureus]|uniref:CehA/McbA family metallohydrolase n=1 Tax=Paenibacillus roseopurpureus TaxID=2918901 RepID=A0AA96LQD6_9BACL|nr:CehA/McbA family metallohydrolase [Paenibacillus sp. MBLB1832]WNR45323.1 CehA/McbA family metallohydrolase [Paenibacillus sp. MBLB1832]
MVMKKYLQAASSILSNENGMPPYSPPALLEALQFLEDELTNRGFVFRAETTSTSQGTLKLTVTDTKGNGMIAQVKLFPMLAGETMETISQPNNRIDFIREYSLPGGTVTLPIPSARYVLEVSKGPSYKIVKKEITINADEELTCQICLPQMADWRGAGWYAGDLHHHSVYSSPLHGGTDDVIESPQQVAFSMEAAGLAYGALSDHHNIKNHQQWLATATDTFLPIVSKEISTTNGHVLSLGVHTDVIYKIPKQEERTEQYLRQEHIRTSDEIRASGGLPQINHPCDRNPAISLDPKFTDMIEIFDTIEIWNGSNPMIPGTPNYDAFNLWLSLLEEGRFVAATSGSDTHNIWVDDFHGLLEKFSWIVTYGSPFIDSLPVERQDVLRYLMQVLQETTPIMEEWAENRLGSGCVQTYIQVEQALTVESILDSLRKGHSFLTSGPLLKVSLEGKGPGETLVAEKTTVSANVTLISNVPLERLCLYTNGRQKTYIPLTNRLVDSESEAQGAESVYDYSLQLRDIAVNQVKWIVVTVEKGREIRAISNPIFIESANS